MSRTSGMEPVAAAFIVVALCVFAHAVEAGQSSLPAQGSKDATCICTLIYDPVCSKRNVTYGNECQLNCAKEQLDYRGECKAPCICTKIYKPVCSTTNTTYGNVCELNCAHATLDYQGECKQRIPDTDGCFILKPVCGVDGITYPNNCSLSRAGVQWAHDGKCQNPTCPSCDTSLDPVCDTEGHISYINDCVAKCQGATSTITGRCEQKPCTLLCVTTVDPVCGTDGVTYSNLCKLRCANAIFAYKGECKPTICPFVILPVCGTDGKTYDNECLMLQAGVKKAFDGKCKQPCVCPINLYKPVCDTATNTSYANACVAKCQGVTKYKSGACPKKPCNFLCSMLYVPVCGTNHHTYSNICQLKCANAIFAYPGQCGTCNCPTEKSPVCWRGKTYDNACLAICKGAKSKDVKFGACHKPTPLCACRLPSNPSSVCAPGYKTFASACDAGCHGYPGPYQSGKCA